MCRAKQLVSLNTLIRGAVWATG